MQSNILPICKNIKRATGPEVSVANGETITPEFKALLPLSKNLSEKAQKAFIFEDLKTGSLVSLGQLCDDDCIENFSKYNVDIIKKDTVIIQGTRTDNGLWSVPLQKVSKNSPPHVSTTPEINNLPQANGIIRKDKTKKELAAYYAATCFSMRPSTLMRATKLGYLSSFPGLSTSLIRNHLPKSIASHKGHLDQK